MKMEDVPLLCSEVVEAIGIRLTQSNIHLVSNIKPCKAKMDRELFKSLLLNLLDNAVKASKSGSSIYLRGQTDDSGQLVIEVEDQGIGIPEKDIGSVLEPFFMVDKVHSRLNNGAGLGLAICAEIVKLHQGQINITSSLNQGTKVQLTFPQVYN